MKTITLNISDISEHQQAAKELIEFAQGEKVFLFDAPMGAGKTTFIKFLCFYLGVTDSMSSPTYAIVNEYDTDSKIKIYHFDLYRLKSSEELFEIGFEDYLSSNNYLFIEWPELATNFLESFLRIVIYIENNNRYLRAEIIKNS